MKKEIIYYLASFILLVTTGCHNKSLKIKNYTEVLIFDKSIPYPTQGIYNWFPPNEKTNRTTHKDDHKLILSAIKKGLNKQGFTHQETTNPNFFIAYYYQAQNKKTDVDLNKNYKISSKDRWIPGIQTPHVYRKNTLVIDVVCAQDNCPRWRCAVDADIPEDLTPQQKQKLLEKIISKMTKQFPPKGVLLLK